MEIHPIESAPALNTSDTSNTGIEQAARTDAMLLVGSTGEACPAAHFLDPPAGGA